MEINTAKTSKGLSIPFRTRFLVWIGTRLLGFPLVSQINLSYKDETRNDGAKTTRIVLFSQLLPTHNYLSGKLLEAIEEAIKTSQITEEKETSKQTALSQVLR